MSNSLYLAALAVAAIDGLEAVSTRPPFVNTDDYVSGGVLDAHGRHWMVKCPKNSHAATIIEAEAALAPNLLQELRRGNLPFDILRPAGFVHAATGGRAVVCPQPFGTAIDWEDIGRDQAREIGRVIASIHSLSHDVVADAGLPVYSATDWRMRLFTELTDADEASSLPLNLLERWEDALEKSSNWKFEPTVVHGDIDAENFLWSDGGIATVTGFGEAKVADPAMDLAPFLSLEESVYAAVIDAYEHTRGTGIDDAMYSRMLLMSELAIPRWLMHGVHTNNDSIQKEARSMLDDLSKQVAEAES